MRAAPLLLVLALAGCGQGGAGADTTGDPVARNVVEAAAAGTPAALAAAVDCGNRPDFVPIYEDAEITTCISAPDGQARHVSGNIVYMTAATPAQVLGWSRAQANAAGLAPRETGAAMYAAGEEARRNLVVRVEPVGGHTRVNLVWGRPI